MNANGTGYRVDAENVDAMQLDGEAVLLNLQTHGYYGLNSTATEVWQLVKTYPGVTASDIVDALVDRYAADAATLTPDVTALLDALHRQSLVHNCPPAAVSIERPARGAAAYVVPTVQAFGDLDTLILSGE